MISSSDYSDPYIYSADDDDDDDILTHSYIYSADDAVELCHAAQSIGPADCFIESRNLGSVSERINLCNGAQNNVRRERVDR